MLFSFLSLIHHSVFVLLLPLCTGIEKFVSQFTATINVTGLIVLWEKLQLPITQIYLKLVDVNNYRLEYTLGFNLICTY